MYVVKHVNGPTDQSRADNKLDIERMVAAKSRSRLGDTASVVATLSKVLAAPLAKQPKLRDGVEKSVRKLVADELRFVAKQTTPAKAVADFYENEAERVAGFAELFGGMLSTVVGAVPGEEREPGVLEVEVPLISLIRNANGLVQRIVETVVARHFDGRRLDLGAGLAEVVVARMCKLSGMTAQEAGLKPHRVKWPKDLDVGVGELVHGYLGDTALATLLMAPVAVKITDKIRMEHHVITAGAGHGKTQTLQHMIACDLDRPKGQEVGMVVIDSQGDLISRIQSQACFAGNDRLIIVDASDVEYPVALNLFNLGGASLDGLSVRDREQVMAATVQLYSYVIGGLFGSEMTSRQATVFSFLIRLMLSIDGATIHTLRECLEEPKNFMHAMEQQPPVARQFFTHEFMDRQFGDTRKQILRRLYGVLQNPAFERMFGSSENRLDLYAALNAGRVVVCNTSREFLQDECRVFGRYCIAVAMKAAFDRARLKPEQRRTSYLYIDEASDYFDESVGQLLVQARKYKLGVVMAHQALEQMSDGLRALVMSNTSIKMVGGASAKDARFLAADMHTSPEFILGQEKDGGGTRFATFVRNVTPAAVSWRVPFFTMENSPAMSAAQLAGLLARNREEVCATATALGTAVGVAGVASAGGSGRYVSVAGVGGVTPANDRGWASGDFSESY